MTTYYSEGVFGVVSFETDPHHDINADAKFWSPDTERWVDCPGSTGIGTDVLYSVDFYPIPADAVEEMQTRCRDLMHEGPRPDRQAATRRGRDRRAEVTARCPFERLSRSPERRPFLSPRPTRKRSGSFHS